MQLTNDIFSQNATYQSYIFPKNNLPIIYFPKNTFTQYQLRLKENRFLKFTSLSLSIKSKQEKLQGHNVEQVISQIFSVFLVSRLSSFLVMVPF